MIIVDCTELFQNPVRAGIQRVVRELLRHWLAGALPIVPARFCVRHGLVSLPPAAVRLLSEQDGEAAALKHSDLTAQLGRIAQEQRGPPLTKRDGVFIPEVFFDPARCRFYRQFLKEAERPLALLAYDFIPYLRPDLFNLGTCTPQMPYLYLLSLADNVAHISEETCRTYLRHVKRARGSATGPALPLGADGLKLVHQSWSAERRGFVALGSLDGRKNQHLIVEAFLRLWRTGHDMRLTLIGRAFDNADLGWREEAQSFPAFTWLETATDFDVARILADARMTIYVPEAEGYGLPPVESLYAGIPAIVSARTPSVAMISENGQIRLEEVTPDTIAQAVLRCMDDSYAEALWQAAATLQLPSWRDFARATVNWLTGIPGMA